ncbi:prepilin-type N-terminal cleavage/methylation domain-containing protein [Candidatus Weimeria sp. HCP3S3_B5]|uniref:prepilin-type N-terminal cleavage/methylation domain-containing protein n=1 Tax=Candidatus Weimeria sp. HCP3S3_B5 TaxID=3438871 RepID=UPI003F8B92DD
MNTKVAKKNNKGFTLIELIVVIAIIVVLAAILAPQYLRYVEKSRVSADESTAKEIKNAVQTACAEDDVFTALKNNDTVEWKASSNALEVSNGTLKAELDKTIKEVPKMKSKKWQLTDNKGVYTITIKVNETDSSVSLEETFPDPTAHPTAHPTAS